MTKNTSNRNARLLGKIWAKIATLVLTAALVSCITVNVNFPESAVQRAADDFVKDLYRNPTAVTADTGKSDAAKESAAVKNSVKKGGKKKAAKAPADAPAEKKADTPPTTWILDLMIASAYAQEINTSTPKAQAIKDKMRTRIPEISKWKTKGALCENDDGLLTTRPAKAGGDAGTVAELAKTENADRNALYEEIREANRITDRNETKIRKFFSAAFKSQGQGAGCP